VIADTKPFDRSSPRRRASTQQPGIGVSPDRFAVRKFTFR
jgi:hypothetical protein